MTADVATGGRPLLEVAGLTVRRGRAEILHGVDLTVAAGEIVAVLGPNGAGKSTLLQCLGGVLSPSAGRIGLNGRVATALQSPDLARRSARANVELALAWWGVPRRQRRARAADALAAMRATHLARRRATSLSGGEQRRVHLARVVGVRPDLLLLDEPFAGLDAATRAGLLDDTASALRQSATSVVLVVHDRGEAWALADRIVVMLDGRIAAEGAPRVVLNDPPSPEVARFLGFTGHVRDGDEVVLTRPSHVTVDTHGAVEATVTRVIPLEDGARIQLDVPGGEVSAVVAFPPPAVGEVVRVRIDGGARFPASALVDEGT